MCMVHSEIAQIIGVYDVLVGVAGGQLLALKSFCKELGGR
jgi:hypothetical protein